LFKRKEDGVVVVKDYAPLMFAALRRMDHVTEIDLDLSWHFSDVHSVPAPSEGAGRSGSLFMFSKDRRFLFKTLPAKELTTLLDFLPAYHCMLWSPSQTSTLSFDLPASSCSCDVS
jgi:1-phosphatidylinositol-4-phosphate 5-kinase